MLLIVNADDLGTSQAINDDIFTLMQEGLITSATVITNAPAFEDAAARVRHFPHCSFGVHLNLSVFPPVCANPSLMAVLDEHGRLSQNLFHTAITADLRRALLSELTGQVERALDAGIPVSHFDSHQHVHTIPMLFPVVKSLQRRFRVRKVRSTITLLSSGRLTGWRLIKKQLFRLTLRHVYSTISPEGLGDFRDFHARLMAGRVPALRSLELMVHPGTANLRYNEEVDLLRSNWKAHLPVQIQLGSYHSL